VSVRSFISLLPSLFPTFSLSLSFLRVPSSLPFSLFSVLPPHLSSLILLPLSTFDCSLTCSASLCTYLQRVHTKRNPAFNKQPPIHASFYPKSLHSFSSPCCYSGKRTTPKVTCPFLMERTKRRAMHACKKETWSEHVLLPRSHLQPKRAPCSVLLPTVSAHGLTCPWLSTKTLCCAWETKDVGKRREDGRPADLPPPPLKTIC